MTALRKHLSAYVEIDKFNLLQRLARLKEKTQTEIILERFDWSKIEDEVKRLEEQKATELQ